MPSMTLPKKFASLVKVSKKLNLVRIRNCRKNITKSSNRILIPKPSFIKNPITQTTASTQLMSGITDSSISITIDCNDDSTVLGTVRSNRRNDSSCSSGGGGP
uniref:Uncharacterized protein n=1 Tax=Salix viminalis TaxID=40686 RepID=A0A6N2NFR4_SALVM